MNLKSHLIFTLYTIYGILLKGETGTSGVRVCFVCVLYVFVRAHVTGQQRGRMKGQNARSHAGPDKKMRSFL